MDRRARQRGRVLATVLFTDIVGSSELASRLGDRRWRSLLRAHHALVRKELGRHRGREIDTAGDGFFAIFDRPADAIECAGAIIDGVADLGLAVRAGLHTGEAEVMGDKVGGIAVHTGARVAALAEPQEILVTRTVRDLVAGSETRFEDRGQHELKGIPGSWDLSAVLREKPQLREPVTMPGQERPGWRPDRRALVVGSAAGALVVLGVVAFLVTRQPKEEPNRSSPPVSTGALLGSVARLRADGSVGAVIRSTDFLGVAVSDRPIDMAVGQGGVWVLTRAQLLHADPRTRSIRARIGTLRQSTPEIPRLHGLGVAIGERAVWLAGTPDIGSKDGVVLRVDPSTDEPDTPRLLRGITVHGVAVGHDWVWVIGADGKLTRLRPDTLEREGTIDLAQSADDIAVADDAVWVVSSFDDVLFKIDPSEMTVVRRIPVSGGPYEIAANGTQVWLLARGAGAVHEISSDEGLGPPVQVGTSPVGLVVTPEAIWVANGEEGTLSRVDTVTGHADIVEIGQPVSGIANDQATGEVWLLLSHPL